jgi:hypothetical protein
MQKFTQDLREWGLEKMSADKTDTRSEALRKMMHASEQIFRCHPVPIKEKKIGERPFVSEGHEPEFQASSEIAAEINRIRA